MSTEICDIFGVFEKYEGYLKEEQEIRETIREKIRSLDQTSRELSAIAQKVHYRNGLKNLDTMIGEFQKLNEFKVPEQLKLLMETLPKGQYYRYNSMFFFTMQRLSFVNCLIEFLKSGKMLTHDETAKAMGLKSDANDHCLDLEDYLGGLTQVSNELSRLSVNAVVQGDFELPLTIKDFLNDLQNGFRLLNLKNDSLRKKFDSIKYDMKKVEEVVYELSIRNMTMNVEENVEKETIKKAPECVSDGGKKDPPKDEGKGDADQEVFFENMEARM